MIADLELTIKWRADCLGRHEAESAVISLGNLLEAALDDHLGKARWALDWHADWNRSMAEHNASIEERKNHEPT